MVALVFLEFDPALEVAAIGHILRTLESHGWRIQETSEALGVSRKSLWEKMRRYGLKRESDS